MTPLAIELAPRFRKQLDVVGFTSKAIDDLLGTIGHQHLDKKRFAPVAWRLRDGSPLATLVRLFVAGLPATVADSVRALSLPLFEACCAAELIRVEDDRIFPCILLQTIDHLVLASDLLPRAEIQDYVMRASATSVSLAGLTVRRPGVAALDMGCGAGIQALLAAAHSREVTAIDSNPRAVAFATFNVRLNEIRNVTCKQADLFNWTSAGKYDLVVSNPPFVISTGMQHEFRDSGREGDEVCRYLARRIPTLLSEGGVGQFLANWEVTTIEPWHERLSRWFEGTHCDVLVLYEAIEEASSYVAHWLGQTDAMTADGSGKYDTWMRFFEERGIVGVGYGLITMRKNISSPARIRLEEAPNHYTLPCSGEIEDYLQRQTWVDRLPDDEFLARPWHVSPAVTLDQVRTLEKNSWMAISQELRICQGLCYTRPVTAAVALALAQCDGRTPLGQVLDTLSGLFDAQASSIKSALMMELRDLVRQGFLLPAESLIHSVT